MKTPLLSHLDLLMKDTANAQYIKLGTDAAVNFIKRQLGLFACLIFTFCIINSCSSDDDEPIFIVNDVVFTMNENPAPSYLIGNIPYQVDAGFQVKFDILAPTVINPISISNFGVIGNVYVFDASLFDYEVNPIFSVDVKVSKTKITLNLDTGGFIEEIVDSKNIKITINLIDLDE